MTEEGKFPPPIYGEHQPVISFLKASRIAYVNFRRVRQIAKSDC